MRRSRRNRYLESLFEALGFVFLLLIWLLISRSLEHQGNYLFPGPIEVLRKLWYLVSEEASLTFSALGWTISRVLIGWSISFLLGMIFGTLSGLYEGARRFFKPFIVFTRAMPTAAVAIIVIAIVFQKGPLPDFVPSFLVFFVAFPLIYEAFRSGIENEPIEIINALDLDGGGHTSLHSIVRVLWPDSFPYVLLSITQSFGLSFKVAIMSEIISNSSATHLGIGNLITISKSYVEMDAVIAYSLIAVILVLLIDIPLNALNKRFGDDNRSASKKTESK